MTAFGGTIIGLISSVLVAVGFTPMGATVTKFELSPATEGSTFIGFTEFGSTATVEAPELLLVAVAVAVVVVASGFTAIGAIPNFYLAPVLSYYSTEVYAAALASTFPSLLAYIYPAYYSYPTY